MEIDCKISCPFFLNVINSCPSRPIELSFSSDIDDFFEIIVVLFSSLPYLYNVFVFLGIVFFHNTRQMSLLIMNIALNYVNELIKNTIREPTPNPNCRRGFANPSPEAALVGSLISWFVRNNWENGCSLYKLICSVAPFVLLSRFYLGYSSAEHLVFGLCFGLVFGYFFYSFFLEYFVKQDSTFKKALERWGFVNNLTDDVFFTEKDKKLKCDIDELMKKSEELKRMKENLKEVVANAKKNVETNKIEEMMDQLKKFN